MIHLITGKQAENHITPENDSKFIGQLTDTQGFSEFDTLKGRYVLDIGNQVALSYSAPNNVRLDTGYVFFDGRIVEIQEPISFALQSGNIDKYFLSQIYIRYNGALDDDNKIVLLSNRIEYNSIPTQREVIESETHSIMNGDEYVTAPLWQVIGRGNTIQAIDRVMPVLDSEVITAKTIETYWR